MDKRFAIALFSEDRDLVLTCTKTFAELAEVIRLDSSLVLPGGRIPDLVLWVLADPPHEAIIQFARYRTERPRYPVILLAAGLAADEAVELVKCGATDFLSYPPDVAALRRKVERALLGRMQPAFDSALLRPMMIAPQESEADAQNRRHCFRAAVPPKLAVATYLAFDHISAEANMLDLSIATEEHWGGMLIRIEGHMIDRVPPSLDGGSEFAVSVRLPGERTLLRVHARAIRVRRQPPPSRAPIEIALQYQPPEPAQNEKLQRFWLQCQRSA